MSHTKNWLPDDALEGSGEEAPSRTRDDADRPSMEVRRPALTEPEAHQTALGEKVRRAATAPARTWRRLLGMLALPGAFGFTVLCSSGAAHAEQPAQRSIAPIVLRACSAKPLRSSGYRDMLTRFALRQPNSGAPHSLRLDSSYRDFATRLQPASYSGAIRSPSTGRRYSLRATPSCG
jgi:hypothetical protein